MNIYTKEIQGSGQDIYFLNDGNIAFDKDVVSCAAGFNAVASQREFVDAYGEVKTVSSDLYAMSAAVETSASTLDGKIGGVSAAVDANFLPLSGGEVDHLSVADGLTAVGAVQTDYIKADDVGQVRIHGEGAERHGALSIDFEGGTNNVFVNGVSLSSHIKNAINGLDWGPIEFEQGYTLKEIRERDGVISAVSRPVVSGDIPTLPVSKIENLEQDYATKQFALDNVKNIEIQYDDDSHRIWIVNQIAGLSSWINANKFIKDGMIQTVEVSRGDAGGHPVEFGPYIVITWNTDAGSKQTWLEARQFANVYRAGEDSGILGGQLSTEFKVGVDWNEVARKAPVDQLLEYAAVLSAPVTGAVDVLSAGVDTALSSNIFAVKFLGHIKLYADRERQSLADILEENGLFDEHRRVKNGSMYQITYVDSSEAGAAANRGRYETVDGLTVGDGDYIYVHKHGFDTYVNADEILVAGADKTVFLANPVHAYDVQELHDFVVDNFVKLSGNNDVQGGNTFHGENKFDGTLSVNFDQLFNLRDGKSLYDLSVALSGEIDDLSAALSGEIDDLSVALSGEIDDLSAALSGEIDDLSAALSGEIDDLSAALSGEIDSLSAALSGEIDDLSADLSGEIDSLSAALSGEIDSLSAALSGEIDSLSAALSGEIDDLSVALSGEIDDLSAALSGEIDDLSAALSGEIDDLSAALSGEIDDLSADLSGEIDSLSAALSGEIDSLSAALSGEIDSLSTDLSGEIDDLSAALSAEISARAMISVDAEPVQEFNFRHISREDYRDLVLSVGGVSADPNTLYVISSDNMSMYGQKIIDMADGQLATDAATYGQLSAVDTRLSTTKSQIRRAISQVFPGATVEDNLDGEFKDIIRCLINIRDALNNA